MQIVFDGYVSDDLKQLILEITCEYLTEHLLDPTSCTLLIVMVEEIGDDGVNLGEAEHISDTCCMMRLDDNLLRHELITTLRHELVHVKQFLNGELVILENEIIFNGEHFDTDHESVYGSEDTPWEIEAEAAAIKTYK